jgi:glutathione S-transferase
MTHAITLRYFAARGRAQFLRYYLRARGVPFTDERVPLSADFSAWAAMRDDRSRAGPFHKLPVLVFDGRLVAETLPIAAFLHRTLGDEANLSADDRVQHEMLLSSLYTDITTQIGTLLWAEVLFPGADLRAVTKRTLDQLRQRLAALERTLTEWQWLERTRFRPVMLADCLLWEALDIAKHVFGARLELPSPTLARCHEDFAARAVCEGLKREHPSPITGRPGEADAITKIQALLD